MSKVGGDVSSVGGDVSGVDGDMSRPALFMPNNMAESRIL